MQMTVLAISIVLMIAIALAFVSAIRASGDTESTGDPNRTRTMLIWGMIIGGVIVTVASLRDWPHAISSGNQTVTVNATGYQWYWEFDREEVPVGKPIIFNVHAKDVSHGLGIADPNGRLLFQTQAMPGYVNRVEYIFEKPGTYKVLCLEFCGVAHHDMTGEIKVVAK